jgi:hypothetical protein
MARPASRKQIPVNIVQNSPPSGIHLGTGIQDVLAARLLALMFFVFNLVALPPFIFANPHHHAAWGGNAYNLAAVASAWILADSLVARHTLREPTVSSPLAEVS